MNQQNNYYKGMLIASTGAISWGLSGTMSQYLFMYYSLNPAWLTMVRMLGAGTVLFLLAALRKKKQVFAIFKNRKDTLHLVVFAILGLLFCQYSYLSAIEHSNSGTATVLQTLSVVMVPFFVCISQKKKPEVKEIFSIALALLGVFLIATHGNPSQMVLSRGGLFWGLCAALAAVFYSTLSERLVAVWGSPVITGYGMLIGGIAFTVIGRPWHAYVPMDLKGFIVLVLIVLIGTTMAFLCFLKGVSVIGPDKALLIGALEPVSATVISFLWLHTAFTIADIIGFVCILATVLILTNSRKPGETADISHS